MDQLTERLVEYALALSYEDLPPEVVERTKRLILDTVGCALGAAPWQAPSVARALAADVQSRTPATVMVGGQQTSPDMAAFANGVMTRYLDYNDYCYTHGRGHPSDTIAPVLAAVEAARGDGKSVILGTVMAYDLLLGLADSAAHGVSRGWGGASFQVIAPDAPGHRHGRLVAYLPEPQPRRADLPLEGGHLGQRLPQRRVLCPGGPARDDRAGGRL